MHLVRHVRGNRPRVARPELQRLIGDPKVERPAQAHAELLVLVPMLRDVAPCVELDDAECDAVTVDHARVDAVPDLLQVERGEVGECAHEREDTGSMKLEQTRANVFRLTATSGELSALVAAARMALDVMRGDPNAPPTTVELVERVLEDYDAARHRLDRTNGRQ
jgi:hypothetical protein